MISAQSLTDSKRAQRALLSRLFLILTCRLALMHENTLALVRDDAGADAGREKMYESTSVNPITGDLVMLTIHLLLAETRTVYLPLHNKSIESRKICVPTS